MSSYTDLRLPLLSLIRTALTSDKAGRVPDDTDFNALLDELNQQSVTALTADVFCDLPLSDEQKKTWRDTVIKTVSDNMRIADAEQRMIALFESKALPCVILKGTASAAYYPNPLYRTRGDIDILIHPDAAERADGLLRENGYRPHGLEGAVLAHKHLEYFDPVDLRTNIELHLCVSLDENGDPSAVSAVFDRALDRRLMKNVDGHATPVLPEAENGLLLLVHFEHHLVTGIGLRQWLDWLLYADHVCHDDFWKNELEPLARDAGLVPLAKTMTKTGNLILGLCGGDTWFDDADPAMCDELLSLMLQRGNFGRKQESNKNEKIVSTITKKSGSRQLFKNLQTSGLLRWEACQKHPILRPFAWLYTVIRYLKETKKSGGSLALLHDKQQADSRRRLFDYLNVKH